MSTHQKTNKTLLGSQKTGSISVSKLRFMMTLIANRTEDLESTAFLLHKEGARGTFVGEIKEKAGGITYSHSQPPLKMHPFT